LPNWAESHKPAASASTHLMSAWLMWATVGVALAGFGALWLWEARPSLAPWLAAGAVVVGLAKSRLVLDGVARRVVGRISARGDGRCLGGFLSVRTWGLVLLMMAGGRVFRGTAASWIVGPLYVAVGTALVLSSRVSFRAWRESRH
jgi:hypothetical protein